MPLSASYSSSSALAWSSPGNNQIQAAEQWEDTARCQHDYVLRERICPDNPYMGGRSQFWVGLAVTIVGGVVLYYGTRQGPDHADSLVNHRPLPPVVGLTVTCGCSRKTKAPPLSDATRVNPADASGPR